MPASLIAAGDALARFFAAPEIGSVPHRSARQGILILVAFIGGMLPISNMAMLSSAYLALSGDFNADLIDLGRLALGNLLIMGLVQPLVNHIHAGLGLRGALFLALCVVSVAGVGAASSGSLTEMTLWLRMRKPKMNFLRCLESDNPVFRRQKNVNQYLQIGILRYLTSLKSIQTG